VPDTKGGMAGFCGMVALIRSSSSSSCTETDNSQTTPYEYHDDWDHVDGAVKEPVADEPWNDGPDEGHEDPFKVDTSNDLHRNTLKK